MILLFPTTNTFEPDFFGTSRIERFIIIDNKEEIASMGKGEYLGELEQVVLLAILALGPDAYGIQIRDNIENTTGRSPTVPTVYAVLSRLETKGYLVSQLGPITSQRGGRAKRFYELLPSGRTALGRSRTMFDRMWKATLDSGANSE